MEDMQTDPLFNFEKIIGDFGEQKDINQHGVDGDKCNGIFKGFDESSETLDENNCDINSETSVSINSEAWNGSDNEEDNVENNILENGNISNGIDCVETNHINNKRSDHRMDNSLEKLEREMENIHENNIDKINNISDSTSENQEEETDDILEKQNGIENESEDKSEEQIDDKLDEQTEQIQDNSNDGNNPIGSVSENNILEIDSSVETGKEEEEKKTEDSLTDDNVIELENDKSDEQGENNENNAINCDEMPVDCEASNNDNEGDGVEEDGYDFDPSLLCPEVSMAVEEAPVITNNVVTDDGSGDAPCAPVFSTYIDEATGAEVSFNLTVDEENLRHKTYGRGAQPIQFTKIHCTACNVHLGSALDEQKNRFVHPFLKVLICKKCYHFYTSGDFEKDEDGSELYCRWCGQGGQVICCSKCEFVFCKKCIRTNVGRNKLNKIKNSDEWNCFRCNMPQISHVRVACVELFQYVQQGMSRASMMDPSFLTEDHTFCCKPQPLQPMQAIKRSLPNELDYDSEMKKKKRKISIDPDYDPLMNDEEKRNYFNNMNLLQSNNVNSGAGNLLKIPTLAARKEIINNNNNIPTNTKYIFTPASKDNDVEFIGTIPATTLVPPGTVPAPIILRPNMSFPTSNIRFARLPPLLPAPSTPIMPTPNLIRMGPPSLRRISNVNAPATSNMNANVFSNNIVNNNPTPPHILKSRLLTNEPVRNEWFQKTVRAASRVNSNLSFTLTNLDRAQSEADSIEDLAVVHNRLQEILSSTINSLIQIRKNLRTEFIAGIKTVRLPNNRPPTQPIPTQLSNNDDDVIFVSTPPLVNIQNPSFPVPLMTTANRNLINPSTSLSTNNPVYVINPHANMFNSTFNSNPPLINNSSNVSMMNNTNDKGINNNNNVQSKAYLKVRSVSQLQNVPYECITIPDGPEDPLKITEFDKGKKLPKTYADKKIASKQITPNEININENKTANKPNKTTTSLKKFRYNINDIPSKEIKRMLTVKVLLNRLDIRDKLSVHKNSKKISM